MLLPWEQLPLWMKTEEIAHYYTALKEHRMALIGKRLFDVAASALLLVFLSPLMTACGLAIKVESAGPVIFRQRRITQYGKAFTIYKFRTMVNKDTGQLPLTVGQDSRITRCGKFLRKTRLDELPQLWNIFIGEMSFVGARPEVPCYVAAYTPEMLATLLLPAGLTSRASVAFRREGVRLERSGDPESCYLQEILPEKMAYNLDYLLRFSLWEDVKILAKTLVAVVL